MGNTQRKRLIETSGEPGELGELGELGEPGEPSALSAPIEPSPIRRQRILFNDLMSMHENKGAATFTKIDYIAILLRLEPSYNNAMMAAYTNESLRNEIRNIIYSSQLPSVPPS